MWYFYPFSCQPLINPIINPDDILLVRRIPKLVIVRDAVVWSLGLPIAGICVIAFEILVIVPSDICWSLFQFICYCWCCKYAHADRNNLTITAKILIAFFKAYSMNTNIEITCSCGRKLALFSVLTLFMHS